MPRFNYIIPLIFLILFRCNTTSIVRTLSNMIDLANKCSFSIIRSS